MRLRSSVANMPNNAMSADCDALTRFIMHRKVESCLDHIEYLLGWRKLFFSYIIRWHLQQSADPRMIATDHCRLHPNENTAMTQFYVYLMCFIAKCKKTPAVVYTPDSVRTPRLALKIYCNIANDYVRQKTFKLQVHQEVTRTWKAARIKQIQQRLFNDLTQADNTQHAASHAHSKVSVATQTPTWPQRRWMPWEIHSGWWREKHGDYFVYRCSYPDTFEHLDWLTRNDTKGTFWRGKDQYEFDLEHWQGRMVWSAYRLQRGSLPSFASDSNALQIQREFNLCNACPSNASKVTVASQTMNSQHRRLLPWEIWSGWWKDKLDTTFIDNLDYELNSSFVERCNSHPFELPGLPWLLETKLRGTYWIGQMQFEFTLEKVGETPVWSAILVKPGLLPSYARETIRSLNWSERRLEGSTSDDEELPPDGMQGRTSVIPQNRKQDSSILPVVRSNRFARKQT